MGFDPMSNPMRRWQQAPIFSASVALVIALVVMTNATAFSAIWGAMFKPLPFRNSDDLVELRINLRDIDFQVGLSSGIYEQLKEASDTFDGMVGSADVWQPRLDENGAPWRLQRVTADFSVVLGVDPAKGRALSDTGISELLLSDRAWRQHFSASPDVIGHPVKIGSASYVVAGVMPPGFGWPDSGTDAWTRFVPSQTEREQELAGAFGAFHVVARLAPEATIDQAEARLDSILRHAGNPFLSENPLIARPDVRPLRARFVAGTTDSLLSLQAAALLLLLIAGANLANLTIERVSARFGDYAVRRAIGARWKNLIRVVASDVVPAAVVGTLSGLLLTIPLLWIARSRELLLDPMVSPTGIEWSLVTAGVLAAALVLLPAMVTGAVFVKSFGHTGWSQLRIPRSGPLRIGMLAAQIAIATALCGSAGLLMRSALNLQSEDRGFDPTGVLLTQVDLGEVAHGATGPARHQDIAQRLALLRESIERQPGVVQVAFADMPPFGGAEFKASIRTSRMTSSTDVRVASVEAGYFEAMGITILAGQSFNTNVSQDITPVIVDEEFQRRWLAPTDGVGTTIRLIQDDETSEVAQIVGVVRSVKQRALTEVGQPMLYVPMLTTPTSTFMVTRSEQDPGLLAKTVQRELHGIAPDAALTFNQPLSAAVEKSTSLQRSLTEVALLFSVASAVLCILGCFAVVSSVTNRRTAEVGLRIALGANPSRIRALILRQGVVPITLGVLAGIASGMLLARLFANRLYRTLPDDSGTWLFAATAIAVLALIACWLPASRAAKLQPTAALSGGSRNL